MFEDPVQKAQTACFPPRSPFWAACSIRNSTGSSDALFVASLGTDEPSCRGSLATPLRTASPLAVHRARKSACAGPPPATHSALRQGRPPSPPTGGPDMQDGCICPKPSSGQKFRAFFFFYASALQGFPHDEYFRTRIITGLKRSPSTSARVAFVPRVAASTDAQRLVHVLRTRARRTWTGQEPARLSRPNPFQSKITPTRLCRAASMSRHRRHD